MRDHHEFESPVDLTRDAAGRHPLLWSSITIAVASLFLLATNAITLRGWIDEQPPSPIQAQLAEIAGQWEGMTDSIGLGVPRALLHRHWKAAEAARFKRGTEPDQR